MTRGLAARIPAEPEAQELMAAEYVLGTLDARAAAAVGRAMRRNAVLRGRVEAWEARLMPLEAMVPEAAAPAGSWERLERAVERVPQAVRDLALDEGAWIEMEPGISRKPLWREDTFLLRVAAGAVLPAHPHPEIEHCVVVSGRMVVDGKEYGPGDYQAVQAGTAHAPITAPEGLLLLIRRGD